MEMTKISDKFLHEMLEKLIFEEEDLKKIKVSIDQAVHGHITSKKLRQQIIESRGKIIEKLLEYIPFYIKQWSINNSINGYTYSSAKDSNLELEEQLNDKNKFLEDLGNRIKKIYNKLN